MVFSIANRFWIHHVRGSGLGGRVKTGQYDQLDILAVMTSAAL